MMSKKQKQSGVALVMAISSIAILALMLVDMQEGTTTAYLNAVGQRDRLRAEYMAKSGLNLTRLLVASEPTIHAAIDPIYRLMIGKPSPQLPVWRFADEILQPFCDYESSKGLLASQGSDLSAVQGLGETHATCSVTGVAENSKINVNAPLSFQGQSAQRNVAMQLFGLTGGYQSPSPYDTFFSNRDPDNLFTSRLDLITSIVDWWDFDTDRTLFDPTTMSVTVSGVEDDVYSSFKDPYRVKNAPMDSLEELRLIRGVSDDFWATFVEPESDDLDARRFTIYASGFVNPNEATPQVLLARVCAAVNTLPICADPLEGTKFVQLLSTARSLIPVPFFAVPADFLTFIEGGGGPRDLYPMLKGFLGETNPLLFKVAAVPSDKRGELENSMVTASRILTLQSIGRAGNAQVRIRAVVNFHDRWTPPPPNAGGLPPLGVFHHYRID